ncbi:hypothetical protein ACFFQF_02450 [Haladaptatus pallidirubidus]|uniref:XapX domain-containing protein n=1 Tax=Haladaptatus pallidirubidus TaxID=1008152 RepID=A0AAV3UAM4_9EURY|nr:hypothetical protein [Haladaptatus pallidirubidus]
MDRTLIAGIVLTVLGLSGYLVGVVAPYPGRAFSITGVMVGITFLAISNATQPGESA